MPQFQYEALDKGGKQVRGVIIAQREDQIVEKLREMGYYPLRVIPHAASATQADLLALPGLRQLFHRIKRRHLMAFTRQLATLVGAGLPIVRSLTILKIQTDSVLLKEKIDDLISVIERGGSLSEGLARHPRVFDRLYVNMVRAGEIGGVLEAVLERIAEFIEKSQMIRGKIKSALMYPLTVTLLALAIVSFILVTIIPKFEEIFRQLGADLPWPTLVLVEASRILVQRAPWVIAGAVIIWVLYRKLNATRDGKYFIDTLKLRLFVFGPLIQKAAVARFSATLSTLVQAGVPILQALDIVRDTSGNEVIARAMDRVYDSVKDGETIHEPLSRCPVFPPLAVHMLAVGEETGAIDLMLNKVAEAYEREVEDAVNALTAILEPFLLVFLGTLVGAIVIALYLPLFILPIKLGN